MIISLVVPVIRSTTLSSNTDNLLATPVNNETELADLAQFNYATAKSLVTFAVARSSECNCCLSSSREIFCEPLNCLLDCNYMPIPRRRHGVNSGSLQEKVTVEAAAPINRSQCTDRDFDAPCPSRVDSCKHQPASVNIST